MVPIGRMGTGWDIAHAVLFLVSDEAAFITGTEIVVDGGYTTFGPSGTWVQGAWLNQSFIIGK